MNILDENIARAQRELLEGWRIAVKQIGFNLGRCGMQDEEVIPLLVKQRRSVLTPGSSPRAAGIPVIKVPLLLK